MIEVIDVIEEGFFEPTLPLIMKTKPPVLISKLVFYPCFFDYYDKLKFEQRLCSTNENAYTSFLNHSSVNHKTIKYLFYEKYQKLGVECQISTFTMLYLP